MAEKVKLFELDIDIEALTNNSGKVFRELDKLRDSQKALKKTSADLKKQIQEQNKAMDEAKKAGDSKAYEKASTVLGELKKSYEDTTRAIAKNQSEIKAVSKEYNISGKLIDAYAEKQMKSLTIVRQTDGSLDQISAALSKNKAAYKSLSKEERENSEIGGKLLKLIREQDAEYKTLHKSIGNTKVEVGNYKEAIQQAFKEGDFFNKSLQGMVTRIPVVGDSLSETVSSLQGYTKAQIASARATEGAGKSLKLFRIAIISTGIGAIVVAIGTLVAAFLSTQSGIDKVTKSLKPVQVIFQRLWGVVQDLGSSMVDAFSNPVETIKNLWKAIKTRFVNRITGIADIFKFLGKTISASPKTVTTCWLIALPLLIH